MPHHIRLLAVLSVFALCFALVATAVPPDAPKDEQAKQSAPAGGSPEEALLKIRVEPGMKFELWAAEPLLANPVAFCFDEKGRVYVAETTRFENGVPDTRKHMAWLDDDLANRTTADRLAMYRKHKYEGFEKFDDQVRLVWDSTGSGRADKSTVFSNGYNRPEDGLAAGVLARKGSVYLTCIPDLYRLRDTTGAGKASEKKSLFTGFGPTAQFLGHDLHGLRMGPDGRLYFTVGDRGFNVTTKEGKQLHYPNTGAVLRCDPDGANLEVVHWGLRNPQKLAFDDHGNLFTFDNNCDSGDGARWVHVVEGGDSGWRGGYQYGTLYNPPGVPQGNRGPWNAEKMWVAPGKDGEPPAFVVPPLANFGNGPAGMTHYPGIGLNDKYKDNFFACDFTGGPERSVIWAVGMKPKGASFEVTEHEPFVRGMLPTDCEFGPDGAFYWSDWVNGWNPPGKGRIFRVTDPEAMKNPAVAEARKLLAEGFEKRTPDKLAKLLEHPHQQVRLEAQYELAGRKAVGELTKVAKASKNQLARLHAVWGLGMVARKERGTLAQLQSLLADGDADTRAATVKALGDAGVGVDWVHVLYPLLKDPEPRVRFQAAIAISRPFFPPPSIWNPNDQLGTGTKALFEMLQENADHDPYIRHAGVAALANLARSFTDGTLTVAPNADQSVRLAVVLIYRRLKQEKVAEFLKDADPKIVSEAARAIHDERIEKAVPALAALAAQKGQPEPVAYRALAANYTLGSTDAAARVAKLAARSGEPEHQRIFALKLLADWSNPPRRDPITGLIHDLPKRDASIAVDALRPVIAGVFAGSDAVRAEAARVSAKLGIKEVGPLLTKLLRDAKAPASARAEALFALAAVNDPGLAEATRLVRTSPEPKLRAAGLTVQAKADPNAVLKELPTILKDAGASLAEKQAAFAVLGRFKESADADKLLDEWLAAVTAGKVLPELLHDVLEAAETRFMTAKLKLHTPLKNQVEAYRAAAAKSADKLAPWAEALAGGDAEKGRGIFLNNSAVYCQRCHKLDGQGGDVGPPLNGIAGQPGKDRRYLLESVVLPSAQIAKGYETAILSLADGRSVSGLVKEETKQRMKLLTPDGKELVVSSDEIESRRTGLSAMPDDLHQKLTRRELRDLVEFLSSLKEAEVKRHP